MLSFEEFYKYKINMLPVRSLTIPKKDLEAREISKNQLMNIKGKSISIVQKYLFLMA